jgi:catechol 2,3-dioxygenase-like lactoylglutathione lyase family enzyme
LARDGLIIATAGLQVSLAAARMESVDRSGWRLVGANEHLLIERVELRCPEPALDALARCYGGELDMPWEASRGAVTVRVGGADLVFTADPAGDEQPFYHFALLVPGNRFGAAHAWLGERVPLLAGDDGITIFDFDFWNARACYFHDPMGNIIELIAHEAVAETPGAAGPFSGRELAGVSEVGIVTPDAAAAAATLGRALDLELWFGGVGGADDLGFVGRRAHTLILARPGRGWLPTGRPAEIHPLDITLTGAAEGSVELAPSSARVRLRAMPAS